MLFGCTPSCSWWIHMEWAHRLLKSLTLRNSKAVSLNLRSDKNLALYKYHYKLSNFANKNGTVTVLIMISEMCSQQDLVFQNTPSSPPPSKWLIFRNYENDEILSYEGSMVLIRRVFGKSFRLKENFTKISIFSAKFFE